MALNRPSGLKRPVGGLSRPTGLKRPVGGLNRPASAAPTAPANLTALVFWVDPFDINLLGNAGIANNDPIGTWKNKGTSGASGDWLQAGGAFKPLFQASGINGHPSILSATGKVMASSVSPVASEAARHIFVVTIIPATTTGNIYRSRSAGTESYDLFVQADIAKVESNNTTTNNFIPAAPPAGFAIIEMSFDGVNTNNPTYVINGVSQVVTNGVGVGVGAEGGAAGNGTGDYQGLIGDILVYSGVQSAAVVAANRACLLAKWS